jgi:hypothetical protein
MEGLKLTSGLRGKRFLITQGALRSFAGSEITTFELAYYLKSQDAEVDVFTTFFHDPIKQIFDKNKIRVVKDRNARFNLMDFDYIWVHHQILPKSIIEQLSENLPSNMPKFIFHHMSPHDFLPIERPFIWKLESKLSSLTLFNSPETRDVLMDKCFHSSDLRDVDIFPNPAPLEYSRINYNHRDKRKEILMVSNHPPREITEVKQELSPRGLHVVSLGEGQDAVNMINAKLLERFDVVVTIGKTVQYCLVAGIPVYVYDHFGGPGYLNSQNLAKSQLLNFSGRGFERKSIDQITNEILSGYSEALGFQQKYRKKFRKEFSINDVLVRVLNETGEREIKKFDKQYEKYVAMAQDVAFDYNFGINERAVIFKNELQVMKQQIDMVNRENVHLKNQLREKSQLLNSLPYRIVRLILKPLNMTRRTVKKIVKGVK